MATMNVSLPDKMKEWVEQQRASGRYATASDYVRDVIRKDKEREEAFAEMTAAGEEGLASGVSDRTPEQIRAAVKAEFKAMVKRRAV